MIEDFYNKFKPFLNEKGYFLNIEEIKKIQSPPSINMTSFDEDTERLGLIKTEYETINTYELSRGGSHSLFIFPFSHVDARTNLLYLKELKEKTDYNLIFVSLHKSFFKNFEVTHTDIKAELNIIIPNLIKKYYNSVPVIQNSCFGFLNSRSVIDLFDIQISYAPMIKNNTKRIIDPHFISEDILPTVYFYLLFIIMNLEGKVLYPVLISDDVKTVSLRLFREFFNDFNNGFFQGAKYKNYAILTENDKVIHEEDAMSNSFDEVIYLEKGKGIHGANFISINVDEFVEKIKYFLNK